MLTWQQAVAAAEAVWELPARLQALGEWAVLVGSVAGALLSSGAVAAWVYRRIRAAVVRGVDAINAHIGETVREHTAPLAADVARLHEAVDCLRSKVDTVESRSRELESNGGDSMRDHVATLVDRVGVLERRYAWDGVTERRRARTPDDGGDGSV